MRKIYYVNNGTKYILEIAKSYKSYKHKDLQDNFWPAYSNEDDFEGYTLESKGNNFIITRFDTKYKYLYIGIRNNSSSKYYNKYEKVLKQHIKNAVYSEPIMMNCTSIIIGTKYTIPKIIFDIEEEKHELKLLL